MESLTLRAVLAECRSLERQRVTGVEGTPGGTGLSLAFGRAGDHLIIDVAGEAPAIYRLPGGAPASESARVPGGTPGSRSARPAGPPVPAALGSLPAERLMGAGAAGFEQWGLERVAFLVFDKRDRLGDPAPVTLVVEMLGLWGNLILLDGAPRSGRILARLRADNRSRDPRLLARGDLYVPPARHRVDLLIDGPDTLRDRLNEAPAPESDAGWAGRFLEVAAGAGPLLAQEVVARAGAEEPAATESGVRAGAEEPATAEPGVRAGALVTGERLVAAWKDLVECALTHPQSCVYHPPSGRPRVLPFKPRATGGTVELFQTVSEAIRRLHEAAVEPGAGAPGDRAGRRGGPGKASGSAGRGGGIGPGRPIGGAGGPGKPAGRRGARDADDRHERLATLERRLEATARRHLRLQFELERRADGGEKRRWAEALLANPSPVPRGATEVTLPSPAGEETLTIPLDPALSVIANAERFFKEARKSEQAAILLPARIAAAAAEVVVIREEMDRLRRAAAEDSAGGRQAEPPAGQARPRGQTEPPAGPARPRGQARPRGVAEPPASPMGPRSGARIPASMQPRRYELPGGWVALVGRSQAGNDYLTHRLAAPRDLWFHAHGASGSHVVLKAPDPKSEPDRSIILAAAALAALHSRARHASKVPVIYTEKRHVRKPRGAKPGLAAVTHEKSVMVKPGEPSRGGGG